MTGDYLRIQIYDRIIRPIVAFREYIFRDVLPAFSNIDERANQVAEDYYDRIGAMPAPEFGEIDMADVAENARDHSYAWWEMMNSLRQTMLNLLAAGLFHLTEQQLAALSSDVSFDHRPLNSTKLWDVADWYVQQLRLDIKSLPSWNLIEELRFVANAINTRKVTRPKNYVKCALNSSLTPHSRRSIKITRRRESSG